MGRGWLAEVTWKPLLPQLGLANQPGSGSHGLPLLGLKSWRCSDSVEVALFSCVFEVTLRDVTRREPVSSALGQTSVHYSQTHAPASRPHAHHRSGFIQSPFLNASLFPPSSLLSLPPAFCRRSIIPTAFLWLFSERSPGHTLASSPGSLC